MRHTVGIYQKIQYKNTTKILKSMIFENKYSQHLCNADQRENAAAKQVIITTDVPMYNFIMRQRKPRYSKKTT